MLGDFEFAERSFVTAIDGARFRFGTDRRSDPVEVITELVESIGSRRAIS